MLKRDELTNPNSCINKAEDDEPVFVLRANDELAAETVEVWATMYGVVKANNNGGMTEAQVAKQCEARELAEKMRKWNRERKQ